MPSLVTTPDISMELARAVEQGASQRARDLDLRMNVAVVDAGGHLKSFVRMDGAWLGSIDIAMRKARTARYFDMESGDLGPMAQPGQPLYHIEFSNGGLITFPGGIPLRTREGTVVGAIGVSGSTVDNDETVAQAGVAALDDALAG